MDIFHAGSTMNSRLNNSDSSYNPDSNRQVLASETIHFDEVPLSLHAVVNQIAQDVILVRFRSSIAVFHLKQKMISDAKPPSSLDDHKYEFAKIHQLNADADEYIEAADLAPAVSLHQTYQKLRYAFSVFDSKCIYFVDLDDGIPEVICKRQFFQQKAVLDNQAGCFDLKFDKDQSRFVACLTDALTCNVWDTQRSLLLTSLTLTGRGISVCWHNTDPFKIMIAQRDGRIVFYNFIKQQCIQSIDVTKGPLLAADWSPSNSCFISCSTHSMVNIVNVAKPYTSQFCAVEAHSCFTNRLKFSPLDHKILATSSCRDGSVKLYKLNQHTNFWISSKKEVQDIEWTARGHCLIVASGKTIYILSVLL